MNPEGQSPRLTDFNELNPKSCKLILKILKRELFVEDESMESLEEMYSGSTIDFHASKTYKEKVERIDILSQWVTKLKEAVKETEQQEKVNSN